MTRFRCPIRLMSLLLVVAAAGPVHAEIYRWVDGNGVTHFSDEPHAGAEKLGNVQAPVIHSRTPAVSEQAPATENDGKSGFHYQSLAIEQPAPEATVRNNPGQVDVVLAVKPGLRSGDRIALDLDGRPVPGSPLSSTSITLHGIYRGAHTLKAHIVGPDGETLLSADPVTFYMHRPSVNLPARKNP